MKNNLPTLQRPCFVVKQNDPLSLNNLKNQNYYEFPPLLKEVEILEYESKISVGTPIWQYWEEFASKRSRLGKSRVTLKSVRESIRYIIKYGKIYTIEDFNNSNKLEDILLNLKDGRSLKGSTMNTHRKNVNTYFIWLERHDYIAKNNVRKVEKAHEQPTEQNFLSQSEVEQIVTHVHTRSYETELERLRNIFLIDLLRFCGPRLCEVLTIKLTDVERFKSSYRLIIQGAKQKGRIRFYLFPDFVKYSYEAYRHYRIMHPDNCLYLFVSSMKKTKLTEKGVRGFLVKLRKELGFKITTYGFRRYVATTLYTQDMPLKKLQKYMGHTRSSTTECYIERSCALTEEAAAVMGKIGSNLTGKRDVK